MHQLRTLSVALLLAAVFGRSAPVVAHQDQAAGVAPVAIRIPRAVVDTTIEPLQITDGAPETPGSTWAVGWYEQTGALADSGNTVLYALPDYYLVGPAAFWFLPSLRAGDTIEVTGQDGLIYPYVVDSATIYDRATAPIGDIFGQGGEEMLTLFTAAPPYDSQGNYLNMMVVLAAPVGEPFALLRSGVTDASSDPCALAPHSLTMNGQSLAPIEVGAAVRDHVDQAGAVPTSDEDLASIEAALQDAAGCPVSVREGLLLADGRILTLVGPPCQIPLDELVSLGGFNALSSAPEAKTMTYVLFTQGNDGWVAEGIPSYAGL